MTSRSAPLAFKEVQSLQPKDTHPDDFFGQSTALDENLALVGSTRADGAVYVLNRDNELWQIGPKIEYPGNSKEDAFFGTSCALSNDSIFVGALNENGLDEVPGAGAVYVYDRSRSSDVPLRLAVEDPPIGLRFGEALAVSGGSLLVGAVYGISVGISPGSAYLFEKVGQDWVQTATFAAPGPAESDYFGASVALGPNEVVVGATAARKRRGAVYDFVLEGDTWVAQPPLMADDGAEDDFFGLSLLLANDTLFVGAPYADAGATDAGAVYVFARGETGWVQEQKLVARSPNERGRFGDSLAFDGGRLVVGSPFGDDAVCIFARGAEGWSEQTCVKRLLDGAHAFGAAVALQGSTLLFTDPAAGSVSDGQLNNGKAYFYELLSSVGESCTLGAECVTGRCADGTCAEPIATGGAGAGGEAGSSAGGQAGAGEATGGIGGATGVGPGCGCATVPRNLGGHGLVALAATVLAFGLRRRLSTRKHWRCFDGSL